jgi:hypothetical protein
MRSSETVLGRTRTEEADTLARMAYSPEGHRVIVDIGSFLGLSTRFGGGAPVTRLVPGSR